MSRGLAAVLAALGLVAACSGATDDPGEPTSAQPTGPRTLTIADEWVHTGEPDFLIEAFGSIWSLTSSGYLLRLDPETGEKLDELDIGYHDVPACAGDGATDTAIWTCSGYQSFARFDPETGERTTVKAAKRADQTRIAFSGGLLWFLETGATDLVALDDSGAERARVVLDHVCTNAESDESTVYVLCPTDGLVLEVDAATAAVTAAIDVRNPRQAAIGDDLFVGSGDDLVQIDRASREVLHTYDGVGPATYGDIDATSDEVWVRQQDGTFLTVIDPVAHEVAATLEAPDYPSGGDVLITDDWVWATAFDQNVIVRVAR